ncbi:hypothetical protein GF357_03290 [Candidatus Dojkabacteria bacterium]|nr:hypothetical protein [Candidatus Dojkabacteria bacterium]
MKDQYFGDISHYKETGIIRILSNEGKVKTLVSWMMTENDGSNDGGNNNYLHDPDIWRKYDPQLFDFLAEKVLIDGKKELAELENSGLLQNTSYHSEMIPDDLDGRATYFRNLLKIIEAQKPDLLFFEVDNGIEVKSVKKGNKNSSKYLYWGEIVEFYDTGLSLLIYQHFTRENRDSFMKRLSKDVCNQLNIDEVYIIKTSRFMMFLVMQPDSSSKIGDFAPRFQNTWGDVIQVLRFANDDLVLLEANKQKSLFP